MYFFCEMCSKNHFLGLGKEGGFAKTAKRRLQNFLANLDLFQVNFLVFTRHVPKTSTKIFVEVPPGWGGPCCSFCLMVLVNPPFFGAPRSMFLVKCAQFFLFLGLGSEKRRLQLSLWNLRVFTSKFHLVPKTSAKIFVEVPPWLRGPLLFV